MHWRGDGECQWRSVNGVCERTKEKTDVGTHGRGPVSTQVEAAEEPKKVVGPEVIVHVSRNMDDIRSERRR